MMSEGHVSRSTYYKVYVLLLLLMAATLGAAFVHMGPFNLAVALLIASVKAILVMLFFMHVRFSSKMVWILAASGFVWLLYLLGGTFGDYLTRN